MAERGGRIRGSEARRGGSPSHVAGVEAGQQDRYRAATILRCSMRSRPDAGVLAPRLWERGSSLERCLLIFRLTDPAHERSLPVGCYFLLSLCQRNAARADFRVQKIL